MKLKPYSEYKDSGLPWLGKMPSHWEVRRNGRLFAQRNQTGYPDLPILEVSLRTGVRVRDFDNVNRKQVMSDRAKYKRAAKGDIAYNMMRLWQGAVGVSPVDGLVSPAYVVARPYADVDSRFYAYLFRTDAYMHEVNQYSHGIVADRNRLYWDEFKQMPSAYPPPTEQRVITRFLDAHARLVQRSIRAKRRLIELLNQQKQVIIHRAVTRGLDPNVRLKPSGIDWLGEVPEHWEIKKLKYMVRFYGGGTPSKAVAEYWNGDIPWVSPKDMKTELVEDAQDHITEEAVIQSSTKLVDPGAVLLVVRSGILRRTIPVAMNRRTVALNQDMKALVTKPALTAGYLAALVRGNQQVLLAEWMKHGATVESIEHELLANTHIPVPPVPEQQAIVTCLDIELSKVNQPIDRAYREIDLLREYRTRLIADVVTGKLDVRGVIEAGNGPSSSSGPYPGLPDEAEELDDLNTGEDAEAEEIIDTEETTRNDR